MNNIVSGAMVLVNFVEYLAHDTHWILEEG